MNYCQDGIQVYFRKIITINAILKTIYGHYELQPEDVNGRPYFKMGIWGIWWDGIDQWWIGYNSGKGLSQGFAHYTKDAFCPHQLSDWKWLLWYENPDLWQFAGPYLGITCKNILCLVKTKNQQFRLPNPIVHSYTYIFLLNEFLKNVFNTFKRS